MINLKILGCGFYLGGAGGFHHILLCGTGDAEIGWRPAPEKNIETMPCWGKNSPENCLVDLGRETRTSTQSRRLVRRKGASWSPHWPSGANLLAHMQLKCILNMPL